jgi:hypothetical protein
MTPTMRTKTSTVATIAQHPHDARHQALHAMLQDSPVLFA